MLVTFLMILGWFLTVCGAAWIALALWAEHDYKKDTLRQALDAYNGFRRAWPISKPLWMVFIGVPLLIAYYMTY